MYDFIKRVIDISISLILLILLIPILIVVSILIKLESTGPVFFRQSRIGQNGHPFTIYKFRTMYVYANENIQRKYLKEILEKENEQPVFRIVDDPKITRIGRFLRITSLDELPQLINILKGDMSLVGPRPSLPFEYSKYEDWQKERVTVKPGITGLWQISGRFRMSYDEMVKLDISYIKKRSILLDIEILIKTVSLVLTGKGAY